MNINRDHRDKFHLYMSKNILETPADPTQTHPEGHDKQIHLSQVIYCIRIGKKLGLWLS